MSFAFVKARSWLLLALCMLLTGGCALRCESTRNGAGAAYICASNGNIFIVNRDGSLRQVTRSGRDAEPALAPDGELAMFVRQVADLADNPLGVPEDDAAMLYAHWSPYEVWQADLDTGTVRRLLDPRYDSAFDGKQNRGWFYDLNFSVDGQTIFYACQPGCPTTNAIRAVDRDGSNDRWLCWGSDVGIIDDPLHRYFGFPLVKNEQADGSFTFVIFRSDGTEICRWRQTPKYRQSR